MKKVLAGALLLAVLAALGLWLSSAPRDGSAQLYRGKADAARAIEADGVTNAPSRPLNRPRPTTGSVAGASAVPLAGISTLSQLAALASRKGDGQSQVLAELAMAAEYCRNMQVLAEHVSLQDQKKLKLPNGRRDRELQFRFATNFCDEKSLDQRAIVSELNAIGPQDPVVQAVSFYELADSDPVTARAIAEKLADQSAAPMALWRASDYLQASGKEIRAMTAVPAPEALQPSDRAEVQRLAVMMATCRIRGGCGPDGFYTALWCNRCGPEESLGQRWRVKYSPVVLDYAHRVSSAIGH